MKNIDTEKLSREINDTLVHRDCIMRSGKYLSNYLIGHNRSVDAISLIGRCQVHDISKTTNPEEVLALASIVNDMGEMHNVKHELTDEQKEAIRLHWKNNSHHPEHYESPNDMSELDIMEMACDCHARSKQYGTSLLDYIDYQQEKRFHFDEEHFTLLREMASILVEMTKEDDYRDLIDNRIKLSFGLKDSTLEQLEKFDDENYPEYISTERLFLTRETTSDFATISYTLNSRIDNRPIGNIVLKCNGELDYHIYVYYKGRGYMHEALRKIIEISELEELTIHAKKGDQLQEKLIKDLGFEIIKETDSGALYSYHKPKSYTLKKAN